MTVERLDHVAVPVHDMQPMVEFYERLGFRTDHEMEPLLVSVCQGDMKINLHYPKLWQSERFDLRGPTAQPGSGDICMVWGGTEEDLDQLLADVDVIEGPVDRVGGKHNGTTVGVSRYIRDPEGNLLEFIAYGRDQS